MFDLDRFLIAQKSNYDIAFEEIKAGKKRSHWTWYIFPQLKGLGQSETAIFYAIENLAEAEAFLQHPILEKRLVAICEELLKLKTNDANAIFGNPDDLKLKSSMTLFDAASANENIFEQVLAKFFDGQTDQLTLHLLDTSSSIQDF